MPPSVPSTVATEQIGNDCCVIGYVLRAQLGAAPLWTPQGVSVAPASLPLSHRLLIAIDDWSAFYDDIGGEFTDDDVVDEFVGQGFKLAYALRRELKGHDVWFGHPLTDDLIKIDRKK